MQLIEGKRIAERKFTECIHTSRDLAQTASVLQFDYIDDRPYQLTLSRLDSLCAEMPATSREAPLHDCLFATGKSHTAPDMKNGPARVSIPRSLLALMIQRHHERDAQGTPTGVLSGNVNSSSFSGNATFFAWLLGRLHLKKRSRDPRESANTRTSVQLCFNSGHGRTATHLCKCPVILDVLQPEPRGKIVLGIHSTKNVARYFNTQITSNAVRKGSTDPGLNLSIHLFGKCTSVVLTVSCKMIDAIVPQRGQRCGHTTLVDLSYPNNRACLAAWLLRRAPLVLESHKGAIQFKSRRSFMAAMVSYPLAQPVSYPLAQPSDSIEPVKDSVGRRVSEFSPAGSLYKPTIGEKARLKSRWFRVKKARVKVMQHRRTKVPVCALLSIYEWGAMSAEDTKGNSCSLRANIEASRHLDCPNRNLEKADDVFLEVASAS